MHPSDSRQQMKTLLEREIESASRLLAILQKEHSVLTNNDVAGLEKLVPEKQALVAMLEKLGRQRTQLLDAGGGGGNRQVLERYLQQCDSEARHPLAKLWDQLQALAGECQHQNEVNGGILEIGRRHVQRVLSILRGQANQAELYGPDGETTSNPLSQTLVKA